MPKNSRYMQDLAQRVAAGSSVRAAAAAIKCSERTAYTVSSSYEFKRQVSEIRTAAVQQAAAVLADSATRAAQVLAELLNSEDEKTKLAAAVKILAMLGPLAELAELRQRVEQVEKQPWSQPTYRS